MSGEGKQPEVDLESENFSWEGPQFLVCKEGRLSAWPIGGSTGPIEFIWVRRFQRGMLVLFSEVLFRD